MSKGEKEYQRERMFIDETFFIECPSCKKSHRFSLLHSLKRECIACKQVLKTSDFKYGSETSYRNICNICKQKKKTKARDDSLGLTYTMMPCGKCLELGRSVGDATVRINSKGVFDAEGLHEHQTGIYTKRKEDAIDHL